MDQIDDLVIKKIHTALWNDEKYNGGYGSASKGVNRFDLIIDFLIVHSQEFFL